MNNETTETQVKTYKNANLSIDPERTNLVYCTGPNSPKDGGSWIETREEINPNMQILWKAGPYSFYGWL